MIVVALPVSDRQRLAALILHNLAQQSVGVIHTSNPWTEQDQLELRDLLLQKIPVEEGR